MDDSSDPAAASLMARLDTLAACSDADGAITRLFLSPAHARAVALVRSWMEQAGLATRLDAAATLIGRLEGPGPDSPVLLLGSHLDTVRDGGRYDGALGMLGGLAAIERLRAAGRRLPFAVELLAFGDEEGVRFPLTMTGSRAAAGSLDPAQLSATDADGLTIADALRGFGCDPAALPAAAYDPARVLGFLELHIEQGPVLERDGLALGIVTAINGARRGRMVVEGLAGHAGTVPMEDRRDALVAASAMILAVRDVARHHPGVTATVGQIEAHPGAVNVIPGRVAFTLDVRAPEDRLRDLALAAIETELARIAAACGVTAALEMSFRADAVSCAPALCDRLERAARAEGVSSRRLPSGAGHDAMIMAALCPVGMLFVRCAGGISHNPREAIDAADAGRAVRALARTISDWSVF